MSTAKSNEIEFSTIVRTEGEVHDLSTFSPPVASIDNEGESLSCPLSAAFFWDCLDVITREENRSAVYLVCGVLVFIGAVSGTFGSAFDTCTSTEVKIKTFETVTIYSFGPFGTKVDGKSSFHSGKTVYPYHSFNVTYGVHTYADLHTSAGDMHFSQKGKLVTLENGASNKGFTLSSIFFWKCYQNYEIKKPSSSSNVTSADGDAINLESYEDYMDSYATSAPTFHLRGSSFIDLSELISTDVLEVTEPSLSEAMVPVESTTHKASQSLISSSRYSFLNTLSERVNDRDVPKPTTDATVAFGV